MREWVDQASQEAAECAARLNAFPHRYSGTEGLRLALAKKFRTYSGLSEEQITSNNQKQTYPTLPHLCPQLDWG